MSYSYLDKENAPKILVQAKSFLGVKENGESLNTLSFGETDVISWR